MKRRTKRPRTVPQTLVIIFPSQAPDEAKLEQFPLTRLSLDVKDLFDLSGKLKEVYIVNALENPSRTIIRRAVNATDTGEAAVSISSLVVADVTVTKERGNFFQKLRRFAKVGQDTGSGYALSGEELQISVAASGGAQVTFLDFVRHTFRCKLLSTWLIRRDSEECLPAFFRIWWGGGTRSQELVYSAWLMYGGRPSIFRSCILRHGKINDAFFNAEEAKYVKRDAPKMPDLHSNYPGHNLALLLWYFRGEYFTPVDVEMRIVQLSGLSREQFPSGERSIRTNLQILANYPETGLQKTSIGGVDMYRWDPNDPRNLGDFLLQAMQNVTEQEIKSHGEFRTLSRETWEKKVTEYIMFPFPANFEAALDRLAGKKDKMLKRKQAKGKPKFYGVYRPCPYERCEWRFVNSSNMQRHIRKMHSERPPVRCDLCNEEFRTEGYLRNHKRTAHKESYKCKVCGEDFQSRKDLTTHRRSHRSPRRYECTFCPKGFPTKQRFDIHVRTHTGEKPFECEICQKNFSSKTGLMRHKRKHSDERKHVCETCGAKFRRQDTLTEHQLTHAPKKFECTDCGMKFKSQRALGTHRRIHTGNLPYSCRYCDYKCARKQARDVHERMHTGERPFKCETCGKSFATSSTLTIHERTHTGERPYECKICHQKFTQASHLSTHIRFTHNGEKSHQCDECKLSFSTRQRLRVHMRTHTEEKLFACTLCEKRYKHSVSLSTHMRTAHSDDKTPYKCTVCGKSFTQAGGLQRHKLVHTGEKPHKCKICGKGFARPARLRNHMYTHTGEKPHKCEHCGRGFIKAIRLRKHIANIHSGDD